MESLNHSDLIRRAQRQLRLTYDRSVDPNELVKALNNQGEAAPPQEVNTDRELKARMMSWVLNNYDQMAAQALCDLDCIACTSAHVVLCMLQNQRKLHAEGYLNLEDGELWPTT